MLTVVFVGSGKFDPKYLRQMFTIRESSKLWRFLLWLTSHNRLYHNICLDRSIMDSYPDDDLLPGIEDRIFEDHDADAAHTFEEETSGFTQPSRSS
jgi:hypothetical protein